MLARIIHRQDLQEEAEPPGTAAPDWEGPWPQSPEQFERLIEAFQGRLFRYALRRLGNIQDAEDVVQEIFIQAYAERERRRAVVNVRAYLYRMTANACGALARRRPRPAVTLGIDDGPEIRDIRPGPARAAEAAQDTERVQRLLGQLPEPQAEVLRLRFFDELRFVEIAQVLGTPVATVKSRLRYGLEKLQELAREEA